MNRKFDIGGYLRAIAVFVFIAFGACAQQFGGIPGLVIGIIGLLIGILYGLFAVGRR